MKKVCIFGYGSTGKSLAKVLDEPFVVYSDTEIDDNNLEIFSNFDEISYVIKSPGISYEHSVLQEFEKRGIDIVDELEWSLKKLKGKKIGITGTNGKTTTTDLLFKIFSKAFDDVKLAGNIGIPLSSYVKNDTENSIYICEVSSYQLERLDNVKFDSAIFTNLTPDHLQRHKTMQNYFDAKSNIFREFDYGNTLVINFDDNYLNKIKGNFNIKSFSLKSLNADAYLKDDTLYIESKELIKVSDMKLKGSHNYANALAASLMAYSWSIDMDIIRDTLKDYSAYSHRYEVLENICGRNWINDSKATNPSSTIAALKSVNRPTVLILGGMEKDLDFSEMYSYFNENIKDIVLIGECQDRLYSELTELGYKPLRETFLVNALERAYKISQEGYDILFSPACASWDQYKSYEERGDEFKNWVGNKCLKG